MMTAQVAKLTPTGGSTEQIVRATVETADGDSFSIRHGDRALCARAAFSCLVQPRAGDRVLVADDGETPYILAVLERHGEQDMNLHAPANVQVCVPSGGFALLARDQASIGGKRLHLQGEDLLLDSERTHVRFREAHISGREATAAVGIVRLIGQRLDSMVREIMQRSHNYFRRTQGNDHVQACNLSRKAEGLIHQQSENAVLITRKDMRIDGERIHMG